MKYTLKVLHKMEISGRNYCRERNHRLHTRWWIFHKGKSFSTVQRMLINMETRCSEKLCLNPDIYHVGIVVLRSPWGPPSSPSAFKSDAGDQQ